MKNIFVGNLSFDTNEQTIRSLFEAHGTVDRVSVVTDRDTGQPRGFAFVEMSDNAEGDRAIEADQWPRSWRPRVECERSPPEG